MWDSKLPPRLQWLHNDGYCGEVSTIAAGLKYGQYLSQYDLRDIAVGTQRKEYLVGVNDASTAKHVKMNYTTYPNTCEAPGKTNGTCSHEYLAWVKAMTRRGYAVTITVFLNNYLFYGNTNPNAGDDEYDHIVSVSRIESDFDDDLYHDSDQITFSDHGLYAPDPTNPRYLFTYKFADFPGTRQQANAKSGSVYTLPYGDDATSGNFAIAHTGPADVFQELLPVTVNTSVNYEKPEIKDGSEKRPNAMNLTLTVQVSGLEDGVQYVLYKYNAEDNVPTSNFNAHKDRASESFAITGTSTGVFVMTDAIESSQKTFYRAVRA